MEFFAFNSFRHAFFNFIDDFFNVFSSFNITDHSFGSNFNRFINVANFINENNFCELLDIYGKKIPVTICRNQHAEVELAFENEVRTIDFGDLFSDDAEKRVSCFDKMLHENTIYQATKFRTMLVNTRLSCEEILNLIDTIKLSPENFLASLKESIVKNSLNLGDIFPRRLETIYTIIHKPEQCDTLADYIQLVSESLANEIDALPIEEVLLRLGPLSFFTDHSLTSLVFEKAGTNLVAILKNAYSQSCDPFTHCLIFQCCSTAYDAYPELVDIGNEILDELLKGPTSERVLDFTIALLFSFSDQLNTKRHDFPLYIDPLFALTWSGYIARDLSELEFERKNYLDSIAKSPAVQSAYLISAIRFKFWSLSYVTPEYVYGLIARHVLNDMARYQEGLPASWQEKYAQIFSDFASIELLLPHPLAEFATEAPLSPLDPRVEDTINQQLLADDTIFVFSRLDSIIRTTLLTDSMCQEMKRRVLKSQQSYPMWAESNKLYATLDAICYVATIKNDAEMAASVARIAQQYALQFKNDFEYVAFLICWAASRAYVDKSEYLNFIQSTNELLAFRCTSAQQAQRILRDLEVLGRAEPDLRYCLDKTIALYKLAAKLN